MDHLRGVEVKVANGLQAGANRYSLIPEGTVMRLIQRWRRCGWMMTSLLLVLSGPEASADSWLPPTIEQFLSADKQTRLTVTPRDLESSPAYFEDKASSREAAGSRLGIARVKPIGILEARRSDGGWSELWRRELMNEVAPIHALVSNGGDHVVTFDNWHSVGHGNDVVVIYNAKGRLIESFGLNDFLSVGHIETLPHSVSSIHWGDKHRFSVDETKLILNVLAPSQEALEPNAQYETFEVDLANGAITGRQRNESSIGLLSGGAMVLLAIGTVVLVSRRRKAEALFR